MTPPTGRGIPVSRQPAPRPNDSIAPWQVLRLQDLGASESLKGMTYGQAQELIEKMEGEKK